MNSTISVPYALAVDDDGLIRMNVLDILEDAGFRTLEAENGDRAIAVLEQHQASIALLFTDVQMPGSRDGFALAKEVFRRWPHIAVVVASGHVRPTTGDLPDGVHFLAKPFSAETVHDHLRAMLPDGRKPDPLKA
ncbi:C4-dicarboxylate transport transcriptional regulatory protein DctD [Methylobacterium adhaesivum]|uniref:Response regulator n=1 Tax=Methylobacterium adhaesivum TaxID=333297 RepID=A0ABT8BMY2_9HYPH|nr:response regulator [Methylobacterium adhaesivum]MDN3593144.1 response regulator [Methylobacterium adhaesivum]GJD32437.1 C4-dicarboxylate transport transcriptional regulatory protein DctD [Methylobacterium adhaesivum]